MSLYLFFPLKMYVIALQLIKLGYDRCFTNMEYSAHIFKDKRFQSGSHIEATTRHLSCNHLLRIVRFEV